MKNFDKPVVHLYVLCWNEEKLLPHFLKHYKNVVDKFFVYDNESTDNTIKILNNESNVSIISVQTNNTIRDDSYYKIKNFEWKKSIGVADIVIVVDMDEFLYTENMEQFFIDFHNSSATIIKPIGYDMIKLDFDITKSEYVVNDIKYGTLNNIFHKTVAFKPSFITDINYGVGAHYSQPRGVVKFFDQESKLLHYKYLGLNYFLERMEIYGLRNSEFNKKHGFGYHYNIPRKDMINNFNNILSKSNKVI